MSDYLFFQSVMLISAAIQLLFIYRMIKSKMWQERRVVGRILFPIIFLPAVLVFIAILTSMILYYINADTSEIVFTASTQVASLLPALYIMFYMLSSFWIKIDFKEKILDIYPRWLK